jgi:hypothetical protein
MSLIKYTLAIQIKKMLESKLMEQKYYVIDCPAKYGELE